MDIQRILIFAVAIAIAVLVVGRRSWHEIRSGTKDPTQQAIKSIGVLERLRLGRLTRSEEVIRDPEKSRRAELIARATVAQADKTLGRREVLALPVVLLGVTLLRSEGLGVMFWIEIGLIVSMAVAFLWWKWARRRIMQTASLNGWSVLTEPPKIPSHVRTTTVSEKKD